MNWNATYFGELTDRFADLAAAIPDQLEDVGVGRVAPSLDDLNIGSGRRLTAAVLFFDIRGFTNRTSSEAEVDLKRTLLMLNSVIPTVMQVVYDHDGYVEKNTGDGVMAIVGAGESVAVAANRALDVATTCFATLTHVINPYLVSKGVLPVDARIGIDVGSIVIARIGGPTGSSDHPRNFLTAVGPTANIACKLQAKAGTNEIWAGDLVKQNASPLRLPFFVRKDEFDVDWLWTYAQSGQRYGYWHYNAVRTMPPPA
jgi:adenylate cyclase